MTIYSPEAIMNLLFRCILDIPPARALIILYILAYLCVFYRVVCAAYSTTRDNRRRGERLADFPVEVIIAGEKRGRVKSDIFRVQIISARDRVDRAQSKKKTR